MAQKRKKKNNMKSHEESSEWHKLYSSTFHSCIVYTFDISHPCLT